MLKEPLLIVISAPSGAGKTTLCDRLLQRYPEIVYSVSVTTRSPRGEEVDGEDYHFVSDETFRDMLARGEFLEHAVVHGNRYGTLRATVEKAFSEGLSVLMDIDVAGAARLRKLAAGLPENDPIRRGFVDIFVMPPSLEALRDRMIARGEDSPETIARRLYNARVELEEAPLFRYRVRNENLDHAFREIAMILETETERLVPPPFRGDGNGARSTSEKTA